MVPVSGDPVVGEGEANGPRLLASPGAAGTGYSAPHSGVDGAAATSPADAPAPASGAPRRRPGKPLGYPKPQGSGRKPGTPNKTTAEIRAVAQKHGPKAIRELVKLMTQGDKPEIRLKAAQELLDRGYGRPVQPSTIGGDPEGAPTIQVVKFGDMTARDLLSDKLAGVAHRLEQTGASLPPTPEEDTTDAE